MTNEKTFSWCTGSTYGYDPVGNQILYTPNPNRPWICKTTKHHCQWWNIYQLFLLQNGSSYTTFYFIEKHINWHWISRVKSKI